MKLLIGSLIGLVLSLHVGAAPLLEGRVRLSSGRPAAGVQVRLFDLTDVRQFVGTTTDEAGYFALPLQTLSTGSALPDGFTLGQNYPNPFNPSTIIPYQLPVASHVRLEVLNMLGQHLATLVDGERSAGMHTAQWDATDAAGRAVGAGVYVYRLSGGGLTVSRRMVLVDGQAGIPAVGTIPHRQVRAVAEPVAANSPVYGLTVSGADLIPYINPAFQVGVDEADIVIEEYGGAAFRLMKRAADGILGDVNGDGLVDIADALFVAMYSIDSSALEAHVPNISLGDVDADGDIDFTDAYLIGTYSVNPSDPALPPGIGQAVPDSESSVSETSENQDTVLSHIYWTDVGRGEIQRTNLNGSNIETLITGSESPAGLALDMDGGKIYWTEYWTDASPNASSTGKIQRTDLDGSNTKTLITGLENPFSIALDVERGRIYWTDIGTASIQRANLDGSNTETLITGTGDPTGIALDVDEGKIYWTDGARYRIQRANLDGTNIETLVTGLENPFSIALDVEGGRIYWTDIGTASIQRANLDGSNTETLITGTGNPTGIALDVEGGKIYWTNIERREIWRANLDGRNRESLTLLGLRGIPSAIILDVVGNKMYWTNVSIDTDVSSIQYANLDGSNIKPFVPELDLPTGIALDVDEGKIYWTDTGSEKIQRANLDGSNTETLITGLENPTDIALDVEGGKIYWIDEVRYTIQRANLDGSNIRTLVGGVVIFGIALDVERGKIYWTDGGRYGIQRANLDGSNIETLITELGNPTGIALDMERSKIYWTDEGTDTPGTGTIQRANLDGSNVETFITELGNPTSIALDVEGSKIYWTDEGTDTPGTGTIQRANLDGSNIETFITGLETPAGIALAILDSSNRAESKE